jgi:hypothetical protein
MSIKPFLASVLALFCYASSLKSAEPTVHETIDFISSYTIPATVVDNDNFIRTYYTMFGRDQSACNMLAQYPSKETKRANLADIDPATIEVLHLKEGAAVVLYSKGRRKTIQINDSTEDLSDHIRVTIQNIAPERIVNAFRHLIKLCGGKTEPF